MGEALARYARARRKEKREDYVSPDERRALETIRREAKEHGVTLAHDGVGGIPSSKALGLFRKAKWRCENPECPTPKKDLDLDHLSGHPKEVFEDEDASPKLRAAVRKAKGPKDDRFLHVLCASCHDRVHDRERAIEDGKEPKPMRGEG